MIYTKGERIVINHQRKGQFLATVLKDFDTDKDTWAEVETPDGDQPACRIEFCKFKPYTGKEL